MGEAWQLMADRDGDLEPGDGRLLITLLLCSEKVLQQPLLYLSLYFKRNRDAYYDHVQRVRIEGAWEEWLAFFLEVTGADVAGSTSTPRNWNCSKPSSDTRAALLDP
jgi:hypothetical protein